MKYSLLEYINEKVISTVSKKKEISELERKKVKYGIHILYTNITKILILLIVAILFNVLKEALIIWLLFALLRTSAFGIHSSNSLVCTLVTLVAFVGGGLASCVINIDPTYLYIFYVFCFVCLVIYAPADTAARPLVSKKLRKKLKIRTIITYFIELIIVLLLNNYKFVLLFAFAQLAETLSVIPITYRITNKTYRNYQNYKKK